MKTIAKLCCIILVIGGILWGIGFALGGQPLNINEVPVLYNAGRAIECAVDHWDLQHDSDYDYDDSYRHNGIVGNAVRQGVDTIDNGIRQGLDAIGGGQPTMSADEYNNVRRIKLELGAGEFELREANEHEDIEPFSVEADGVYFRHYEVGFSGEEWKAQMECDRLRGSDSPVIIYLPAGTTWSAFDVELGAGSLTADAIFADQVELSIGAGGAELYIDSPKIDIEVGAGGVTLDLPGEWSDYGYDAECGLGGISVNGDTLIGGIGEAKRAGNRMLDLEVAAGGVEITTAE